MSGNTYVTFSMLAQYPHFASNLMEISGLYIPCHEVTDVLCIPYNTYDDEVYGDVDVSYIKLSWKETQAAKSYDITRTELFYKFANEDWSGADGFGEHSTAQPLSRTIDISSISGNITSINGVDISYIDVLRKAYFGGELWPEEGGPWRNFRRKYIYSIRVLYD